MFEINKKIKELRINYNISQAELASKLNVNQTLVSQWERGICEPSIGCLRNMCFIFDISADELLEIDTEQSTLKQSVNTNKK